MKNILIAHQSTIPHYRVEFFNLLKKELPNNYLLAVVDEEDNEKRAVFFKEPIASNQIQFQIHYTNTIFISRKSKYCWQSFVFHLWKYDIIIVENAINNLSYPVSILYKIIGKKVAFWGHGRDLNNPNDRSVKKKMLEKLKLWLVKRGHGFFAYSESVKSYLVSKGIEPSKIFNVNNTIDINSSRESLEKYNLHKEELNHTLVFTGRLTKSKRIDFLIESFRILFELNNRFKLIIIGEGESEIMRKIEDTSKELPIRMMGSIVDDDELAKVYAQADLYVYPGYVGLGALHAMCFNLIPIVIHSDYHKPEFDYLNINNSYILKKGTTAFEYAHFINGLYNRPKEVLQLRKGIWDSISHLTLQNMAHDFSKGIIELNR